MNIKRGNIFDLNNLDIDDQEIIENILETNNIKIERIVTLQPYVKPGDWYDQDKDEWVILLQGEAKLEWADGRITQLKRGDYLYIPAHKIHRINSSGSDKRCIWLAIHGKLK
ncbi:MAG: cupin domain-containing protein [Bacteroidales bacterium]|nr:cupin domain-containing protein [Bacteroidales bacterium]